MKKLLNKKGFTLMEMMIVIAIIVILVAIAVPSFNKSMDSAHAATDDANLRAAKSAALVESTAGDTANGEYYYDLDDGKLHKTTDDTFSAADAKGTDTGSCGKHDAAYIKVTVNGKADVKVEWSANDGACGAN